MDYFKYIDQVYEEPLAKAVSWRLDFLERTSYSVKGDAQRSFACEIFLITIDDEEHEGLRDLIQSIERLCLGWLSFKVTWTVIRSHSLLQGVPFTYKCQSCKNSLD